MASGLKTNSKNTLVMIVYVEKGKGKTQKNKKKPETERKQLVSLPVNGINAHAMILKRK